CLGGPRLLYGRRLARGAGGLVVAAGSAAGEQRQPQRRERHTPDRPHHPCPSLVDTDLGPAAQGQRVPRLHHHSETVRRQPGPSGAVNVGIVGVEPGSGAPTAGFSASLTAFASAVFRVRVRVRFTGSPSAVAVLRVRVRLTGSSAATSASGAST